MTKSIKFITTFNSNGYHVYGKPWIESFLEFTKSYDNITAKVYVNDTDLMLLNYGPKVEVVDFDLVIPQHKEWVKLYKEKSQQHPVNIELGIKFSYKSFVMIDALRNNDNCYVIWLDGDSIFKSYNFKNFPTIALQNTFVACQRESGSEHTESGIVIFDAEHKDKEVYVNYFESLYMEPEKFNTFGQFFDGFAIGRTIDRTGIQYIDLNKGYGLDGIQSDPNCTFLNPELKHRFLHNIGITGKRSYKNWKEFANKDPMFQLIHGVNDKSPEEQLKDKLSNIQKEINQILGIQNGNI